MRTVNVSLLHIFRYFVSKFLQTNFSSLSCSVLAIFALCILILTSYSGRYDRHRTGRGWTYGFGNFSILLWIRLWISGIHWIFLWIRVWIRSWLSLVIVTLAQEPEIPERLDQRLWGEKGGYCRDEHPIVNCPKKSLRPDPKAALGSLGDLVSVTRKATASSW